MNFICTRISEEPVFFHEGMGGGVVNCQYPLFKQGIDIWHPQQKVA